MRLAEEYDKLHLDAEIQLLDLRLGVGNHNCRVLEDHLSQTDVQIREGRATMRRIDTEMEKLAESVQTIEAMIEDQDEELENLEAQLRGRRLAEVDPKVCSV